MESEMSEIGVECGDLGLNKSLHKQVIQVLLPGPVVLMILSDKILLND